MRSSGRRSRRSGTRAGVSAGKVSLQGSKWLRPLGGPGGLMMLIGGEAPGLESCGPSWLCRSRCLARLRCRWGSIEQGWRAAGRAKGHQAGRAAIQLTPSLSPGMTSCRPGHFLSHDVLLAVQLAAA